MPRKSIPRILAIYRGAEMAAIEDKGYASEAASGALRHAFEGVGGARVMAITDHENWASRRVMEKIGMTYLRDTNGVELGHRMPEIEVVLYSIERDAWAAGQNRS